MHAFHADEGRRPEKRDDLCSVLVVPNRTPALDGDVATMGLGWIDLGGGYARLSGGLFTMYVVEIDVVAKQQGEDW